MKSWRRLALAAALASCGEGAPAPAPPSPEPTTAAPVAETTPPSDAPAPLPGGLPGDAVRSFTATVRRLGGASETFDSRAAKGVVVYVINSAACPWCRDYAERIKAVEATYMPRGVDVVHVYANRGETDDEKVKSHAARGFQGGQVLDVDAKIAHLLEADRTPTVYVVDAKHVIVYRGAVDDTPSGKDVQTPYLAKAVDAALAGRTVEVSSYDPPG